MPEHPHLQARLALARTEAGWSAELELVNRSASMVAHIVRWNVPNERGDLENNMFRIVVPDGERVRYGGTKSKRAPPQGDDFIALAAGGVQAFRASLEPFYDLSAHDSVDVRYYAYHPIPGREDDVFLVTSNVVTIAP